MIRERKTQSKDKNKDEEGKPLPKRYGEDGGGENEEGSRQGDDETKDEYSDIRSKSEGEGEEGKKKEVEEGEKKGEDGGTPKETVEDLQPFPLNRFFRSQPVLSEALRDEIFKKVSKDKKSIREVSVELGVTMERVSAVNRMKEIEKRRIDEVSFLSLFALPCSAQPKPQ